MIIDKYTKAVLTLIAISLFVISLNPWIAPTKAFAELDSYDLGNLERYARGIYGGTCTNSKIC